MSNFSYLALAAGLHKLFALAFLLGLIFFIVWVLTNIKKDKLRDLGVTLLVIGIVGGLILMAFGGKYGWKDGKGGYYKDGKGGYSHDGMWKCMKDDSCRNSIDSMMKLKGYK